MIISVTLNSLQSDKWVCCWVSVNKVEEEDFIIHFLYTEADLLTCAAYVQFILPVSL